MVIQAEEVHPNNSQPVRQRLYTKSGDLPQDGATATSLATLELQEQQDIHKARGDPGKVGDGSRVEEDLATKMMPPVTRLEFTYKHLLEQYKITRPKEIRERQPTKIPTRKNATEIRQGTSNYLAGQRQDPFTDKHTPDLHDINAMEIRQFPFNYLAGQLQDRHMQFTCLNPPDLQETKAHKQQEVAAGAQPDRYYRNSNPAYDRHTALKEQDLIHSDQTGMQGPKVLFGSKGRGSSKDEITGQHRHNENPAPRQGEVKSQEDLGDRNLHKLLCHKEEQRSLIRKHSQVIQRDYIQYQAGYDAVALAQVIQTTTVTSEEDNDRLSSNGTKFFKDNLQSGGHFSNITNDLCHEERIHIRERSLSAINLVPNEMSKEAKDTITTVCGKLSTLSDHLLPRHCGHMITRAINKKKPEGPGDPDHH